ncbi:uncharacterized protein BT62DRAFT_957158 [Guyanagaster necrorhizus]|uniref:Secreted protein n=1 Tax=Guyanagaster necrorhizus TaxID=856835 RepID=A0A9P7VGW9_9AGAR|nr:uncharacterized protein BT62DRAFT_957158 [Guyanagaster necrorhizus MCA 3950]KAG7440357.1 hypothetical protein BT62DRAFT_957158 [Guyanagaster necrorhizus MCA 3950]
MIPSLRLLLISLFYQPSLFLSYPSPTPTPTPTTTLITPVSSSDVLSNVPPHPSKENQKRSHARRQLTGHIPLPRNAFILFRRDFCPPK